MTDNTEGRNLKWQLINWSPYATNVLDAWRLDLCTPGGTPVDFHRDGMRFVLIIRGNRLETFDNLEASNWMNRYEIGGMLKERDIGALALDKHEHDWVPSALEGMEKCSICYLLRSIP